jgi:hypothetical protein
LDSFLTVAILAAVNTPTQSSQSINPGCASGLLEEKRRRPSSLAKDQNREAHLVVVES